MERRVPDPGNNHCLICYSEILEQSGKENSKRKKLGLINNQLHTIFILRNILEFPAAQLANFLQEFGNPSEWTINVCGNCAGAVENAKTIYDEILESIAVYKKVKQEIIKTVRRSKARSDDDEKMCRKKVTPEIRDGPGSMKAVTEARKFACCFDYGPSSDPFDRGDALARETLLKLKRKEDSPVEIKVEKPPELNYPLIEEIPGDNPVIKSEPVLEDEQDDLEDERLVDFQFEENYKIHLDHEEAPYLPPPRPPPKNKRRPPLPIHYTKDFPGHGFKKKIGSRFFCKCGRKYNKSGDLHRHVIQELTPVSYECDLCKNAQPSVDRKYLRREELTRHIQDVPEGRRVPCPVCGKSCRKKELKRHTRQVHNKAKC